MLAAQWRAFVDDRDGVWTHYDGTVMAAAQNHAGFDALHAGELDRAVAALVAARDWYQGAGLHGGVAIAETGLGLVAAAAGEPTAARAHHRAALEAAQLDDDPVGLAVALLGAATVAAERDPARAARLLGAVDAVRNGSHLTPPVIELDAAAVADALRTRLGAAVYDAETSTGRALDRRAAIVLATATATA